MISTIHWDRVWNSLKEFWIPSIGPLLLLFIFFLIVAYVKYKKEK